MVPVRTGTYARPIIIHWRLIGHGLGVLIDADTRPDVAESPYQVLPYRHIVALILEGLTRGIVVSTFVLPFVRSFVRS